MSEAPRLAAARPEVPGPARGGTARERAFVERVHELLRDFLRAREGEDVWQFTDAPYAVVEALGEALGKSFLDARRNASPTARALLRHTRPARKTTTFGGHVVWPPRDDYRVALTSVCAPTARLPRAWRASADEEQRRGRSLWLWWD